MNISNQELEVIKQQVSDVLAYSQDIDNPHIDELFDNWKLNKAKISDIFMDGGLIREFPEPVTFTLSDTQMENAFLDFLERICSHYNLYDLVEYLKSQGYKAFYNNMSVSGYRYNGTKITKNRKILRCFKYFITNGELCKRVQDEASVLIQDNYITGKFCISVHPLDYLSVSENLYSWRSCHALDGEYRAGNLSYMGDAYTFICYIKSEAMVKLPHFPPEVPWNNKKWRVLMYLPTYFSESDTKAGEFFVGRQYPRPLEEALNFIKTNVVTPYGLVVYQSSWWSSGQTLPWSDWMEPAITSIPDPFHITSDGQHTLAKKYFLDYPSNTLISDSLKIKDVCRLHYNDLLYSSCYKPKHIVNMGAPTKARYLIGSKVKCISCGNAYINPNNDTGSMFCDYCIDEHREDDEHYYYCTCCDTRIHEDYAYWVQGEAVCGSCYDSNTAECSCCGERDFVTCMNFIPEENAYYCYNDRCREMYDAARKELEG